MLKHLFYIITMSLLIHKGIALKCFTCSSSFGGLCDKISDKNPPKVEECSYEFSMCYQLVHNTYAIKGQSAFVERGCMEGKTCKTTLPQEKVNRFCQGCDINLCNNVSLYHKNIDNDSVDETGDETHIKPSFVLLFTCFLMYVLEF